MWDFSGKQNEPKIRTEFYSELQSIIYIFDLGSLSSFNSIEKFWMRECKRNSGERLIQILVGNKSDLNREVTNDLINDFIEKYKIKYFELSSKDISKVKKIFSEIGNIIV